MKSSPSPRPTQILALVGGLCLACLPGILRSAESTAPAATPALQPKMSFEDFKVDESAAQREGMWHVAVYPADTKKTAFEDVVFDPTAAQHSQLWNIDVSAGCGDTRCAKAPAKKACCSSRLLGNVGNR